MTRIIVAHLILASVLNAQEQRTEQVDELPDGRYTWMANHDPNGIGKFYMGREIAHVMGFAGALWLERDTREEEERPVTSWPTSVRAAA